MLASFAVALLFSAGALAQSVETTVAYSTFSVGGGVAAIPYTTTMTAPASAPTVTQCWVYETVQSGVVSVSISPDEPIPTDGACFEVYSTGGGVALVPLTTVYGAATPTSQVGLPSVSSASGSSSKARALHVILPAVIGSVVGVSLLVTLIVLLSRRKARQATEDKRTWVERPGGWAQDVEQSQVAGPVLVDQGKPTFMKEKKLEETN